MIMAQKMETIGIIGVIPLYQGYVEIMEQKMVTPYMQTEVVKEFRSPSDVVSFTCSYDVHVLASSYPAVQPGTSN